ncbi:DNA polymerase III subunit gamma/tau [Oceanicola sp. 22II-s10i]|uniref:SRPBCC family protein n=1 Tax=Oceanicola sp. 22II-s10i TaxID=1317116 RepID=UPI000B523800|nr:SRPBCC family protein [Oceanicola sp. 22II-s10i]OWU86626.1 DNA polymerase III subunit gamma/tau [Oceanicola sp. 22II-s10i]
MKFVAKEDIEAPIELVFMEVSDFEAFQRQAMRRGAKIVRKDQLDQPAPGMKWDAKFDLRGRRREVELTLTEYEKPTLMKFEAVSPSIHAFGNVELVALSRNRTRLRLDIEIKPQNLSARLLVQSLKLAKTNLTKRLQLKVTDYAQTLQERAKKRA